MMRMMEVWCAPADQGLYLRARGGLWRDEVRALGGSGSQCVVMSVVAW
jgi:hypothetical protein